MRMLPGPNAGAFLAFRNAAIRIFLGIDQRDIALIRLWLFIQQGKDAVRAR